MFNTDVVIEFCSSHPEFIACVLLAIGYFTFNTLIDFIYRIIKHFVLLLRLRKGKLMEKTKLKYTVIFYKEDGDTKLIYEDDYKKACNILWKEFNENNFYIVAKLFNNTKPDYSLLTASRLGEVY